MCSQLSQSGALGRVPAGQGRARARSTWHGCQEYSRGQNMGARRAHAGVALWRAAHVGLGKRAHTGWRDASQPVGDRECGLGDIRREDVFFPVPRGWRREAGRESGEGKAGASRGLRRACACGGCRRRAVGALTEFGCGRGRKAPPCRARRQPVAEADGAGPGRLVAGA